MAGRDISDVEELALQEIERIMTFVCDKKKQDLPVFTDELDGLFARLNEARNLLGWGVRVR